MCQHRVVKNTDGVTSEYFYGFDKIMGEYFIFSDIEGEESELVGGSSETAGTHGKMLDALELYGISEDVSPESIQNIALDLPCCPIR